MAEDVFRRFHLNLLPAEPKKESIPYERFLFVDRVLLSWESSDRIVA